MKILKALFLLIVAFAAPAAAGRNLINHNLQPESLNYRVMFKWGLINKQAGSATLSLRHGKDAYHSQLTAASEPWADKFFMVRDTLHGVMSYDGFLPLRYEKIAHEGNEDKHDEVVYDYRTPGVVKARCHRREVKKGVLKVDSIQTMEASAALDMITSFYYMRTLPFEKMKPGETSKIAIFSGKQKETLTIKYRGLEDVDIEGETHRTYHITFIFTSHGGKKSSDDMEAYISADDARIPLLLVGKMPVGQVKCFYVP